LQSESYGKILSSLLTFIQNVDFEESKNLQTAVLLTGVNQTDHLKQFDTLSQQISNNCPSIITILQSRDCPTLKAAVENVVNGLMTQNEDDSVKLKRNQHTFPVLEAWYRDTYEQSKTKPSLVIMIADFEQFNPICVQELFGILCSYHDRLPLILVVGVATAFKTLHNVLPSHVTNKIDAHVFQSESSTVMLNKILEEIILTHRSPFQLSGKSFKILMDIFLFYDYSLDSFIKGYKVFMLEHFSSRKLATKLHQIDQDGISKLTKTDCDTIRRTCSSFRSMVEAENDPKKRIEFITSDEYLKRKLANIINRIERYWFQFFCHLRMLVLLLEDLPRNELGKLVRELYPICIASDVTKLDEYQECFNLLRFTSKDKFLTKMDKILSMIRSQIENSGLNESPMKNMLTIYENLKFHRNAVAEAGMSPTKETPKTPSTPSTEINKKGAIGRQAMMEKLKESAKSNTSRVLVDYERHLYECLDYFKSLVEKNLRPLQTAPTLNEFFVFTDCQSVRRQIVGAPRGALHNALSNPQHYLQCSCCAMPESEQILPTLPDIAIAYKLHLECNKFINLYDWLQAFAMVIEVNEDEEDISPEIQ
jgi:origin recognition complex subunit 3